jgi:hypothetical protein
MLMAVHPMAEALTASAGPATMEDRPSAPIFRRPTAPHLSCHRGRQKEMSPIRGYAAARYQTWVVALEYLITCPTISGRSNTDWIATRPGPCRESHTDLACHRAELNQ